MSKLSPPTSNAEYGEGHDRKHIHEADALSKGP